jgi:hypothetical protein
MSISSDLSNSEVSAQHRMQAFSKAKRTLQALVPVRCPGLLLKRVTQVLGACHSEATACRCVLTATNPSLHAPPAPRDMRHAWQIATAALGRQ